GAGTLDERHGLRTEVPRDRLNQDVLLAWEVTEEGRPADPGIGDHVLDPGLCNPIPFEPVERGGVEAFALLNPARLLRRLGHASTVAPHRMPDRIGDVHGLSAPCHLAENRSHFDTSYGLTSVLDTQCSIDLQGR